ncbi:hypothetical protein CCC_03093 [Paramagnetospirillum magnetotacticum MS-1]|uniref:CheW-like domain-containing protein n=1 Tax=Paramagnetospirillum magnetotacticum MS-1 TaxID=272627 RepID=A0A0C2YKI8_PARME|nr:hypothetical protein [Paramagnetospirillum magnetotacticum]KIM00305.1 hypothetical protein CCC_03093 [Paramagnetospirillum magnetotacticum MS-1]
MSDPASLPVVIFPAAGNRFALPARQVAAMLSVESTVTDAPAIEDLLGLPRTARATCMLRLRTGDGDVSALVSGEVSLSELPVESIHPLPPLIEASSQLRGLSAIAHDDSGMILLVDPGRLSRPF